MAQTDADTEQPNHLGDESRVWDEARLQQFVDGQIPEDRQREYKAAKDMEQTKAITIDVSAMANADGGLIIYGIKERARPPGTPKHAPGIPECLAPIDRTQYSADWLDQIIQGIQPRIATVRIHSVPLSSGPNDVAYVVEIPPGNTAHMAMDQRYHRRYNTTTRPMDDYEVREAMNRVKHPVLHMTWRFDQFRVSVAQSTYLRLIVHNTGQVSATHVALRVDLPYSLYQHRAPLFTTPLIHDPTRNEWYYREMFRNTVRDVVGHDRDGRETLGASWTAPILPGGEHVWTWELPGGFQSTNLAAGESIQWMLSADSAPIQSGSLLITEIPWQKESPPAMRTVRYIWRTERWVSIALILWGTVSFCWFSIQIIQVVTQWLTRAS